jgi:hypothetical protein
VHAIAKQNRPLTDYKWLCQVDKSTWLNIGNTYQTGILGFYSVRQIFFPSDNFSKLPHRMSDKLSWIFDMSEYQYPEAANTNLIVFGLT